MIKMHALTIARNLLGAGAGAAMPARTTAIHGQPPVASRPMPGPRGYPLIGVIPDLFRRTSVLSFFRDAWRSHGDAVRLPMGPYTLCFFAHPDAVKHVLVDNRDNYPRGQFQLRWTSRGLGTGLLSTEGEEWRRRRHLMHGPFTVKAVRGYGTAVIAAAEELVEGWARRLAEGRAEIDLSDELVGLSLDALG